MSLRFGVLGPLQVTRDGVSVRLGTLKQRLMLTMLLMEPNRTVPLERLMAALWEDSPPNSAMYNLRSYANKLRQALTDGHNSRVITRRPGYALEVNGGELDSVEFAGRLRQGQADLSKGAPREALRHLSAGLALWRGRPAEDVPRTVPVAPWLDALEEQRCLALESYAAARLELGEHEIMVTDLRTLVSRHPTRERMWGHLMLALYRSGDIEGALAAYAAARQALAERLGVDPGPDLVALHRAMLARDPALAPASARRRSGARCGRARSRGHGLPCYRRR
ncbi:SARP family transcriptional regulator [Nonomuraea phyllanthi]|uniref:SARP family transcriptional regulator n=1 Tax=Nonomuraea phyllanthi TaxID=2219224 RepID=A0A5C4W228_9ACTN|nr:BTAD domain-containing putative transcriptional regulator [Nonomuraea phyllanthi]KAB8190983.1 SARP family transcriptional regulator [Nonomuraea phyllanthi]QFY11977.1 SARP family transcriptional regulator [Nonomuraea phyllanthi]